MKQLCAGLLIALVFVIGVNSQTEKAQEEEKKKVEEVKAPEKSTDAQSAPETKPEEVKKEEVKKPAEKESAPGDTGTAESAPEEKVAEEKTEVKKEEPVKDTAQADKAAESAVAEKDSAVAEEKGTGSLTIITTPDSAIVVFDDKVKGKSPLTLKDIIPGKHTIILKKKGHFAKKATVNVTAGSESELTFDLAKPVNLSISSEPSGAVVSLNKKEVGKTPFVNGKLKPGTYDISLSLAEYTVEKHTVTLASGEKDSMHVTLMPLVQESKDTSAVIEERKDKKDKSKLASILDKVALGLFIGFSVIILVIELTQDK